MRARLEGYAESSDPVAAFERAARWSKLKTSERRRRAAMILAGLQGDAIYDCAVRLLGDPHRSTRFAAISALGHQHDERAVTTLQRLLCDSDSEGPAIRALCFAPSPAAVQSLRQIARTHPGCRLDALLALAARGDRQVVESLRKVRREDASFYDRRRAAKALINLGVGPEGEPRPDWAIIDIAAWYAVYPGQDPLGITNRIGWNAWMDVRRCHVDDQAPDDWGARTRARSQPL